ncbi:MAG: isopentenyl-diphosphate delta-isomerase, partial [Alphaproteobacteria bacterium]|nr:isopentenyl-diphosphate delta-isomerase [Alphaproteobacteria bacterium]
MKNEIQKRKEDHLDLVEASQIPEALNDTRFNYEPIINRQSMDGSNLQRNFLGKNLKAPIWISSITGGSLESKRINENLARAAKEFGLGMGLGS